MEPSENIQAEGTPVEEKPAVEPTPSEVKPAPAKKSFWSKILPWVIVAVVFYVGGLATLYFTLYKSAREAAATASVDAEEKITALTDELAQSNAALESAQTDKTSIQTELDTAKTNLANAESTIADQTAQLANLNKTRIAYKFLVDVNAARAALEKLDTNTALQAITFAKLDLKELEATDIDSASLTGFSALLDEATTSISEPDLLKSRDALDTLYSNLLLLVNNLK